MICFPNAKINLGLFVVSKRSDGYHNIETVFYPVPLCDVLEIVESSEFKFHPSGLKIPGNNADNLCIRAYNLVSKHYKIPPVEIFLHKVIPTGAGLGGGSSDAAHTIKLLNNMFSIGMSNIRMQELSNELGSDCAFFIENKPAYATGRGEILNDVNLSLKGKHIVIIKPCLHVSTKDAYSFIIPTLPACELRKMILEDIINWKSNIVNCFEDKISERYPQVKVLVGRLYDYGAQYAAMSGSGSAVFGIFKEEVMINDNNVNDFNWSGVLE